VGELSHRCIAAFKPFEFSSMLWAFAKFDHVMEPPKWMMVKLFEGAAEEIVSRTEQFSFRCLLMVAWAFVTVRHGDHALFLRLTEAMMPSLQSARCMEIVKIAWVLSVTGIQEERLFHALASNAEMRIGSFKACELSKLLCYFINCNFLYNDFLLKAAHALQVLVLKSNQVVTLCAALVRAMPRQPNLKTVLLVLLPNFTEALAGLRQDEFVHVVWAATLCLREGKCTEQLPAQGQVDVEAIATELAPAQVTTFFAVAQHQAWKHLPTFSGEELAHLAQAFSAVHCRFDTQLLQEVAQEAANRFGEINTEALLSLLQSLLAAGNAICKTVLQPFYVEIAKRLEGMQKQQKAALSLICAESLGLQCPPHGFSVDSLHIFCQTWSRETLRPPPGLSTICPWSVDSILKRSALSGNLDEPFKEMDDMAFGGHDLFQAAGARALPLHMDESGQQQWNETECLDVGETQEFDALQRTTDHACLAHVGQFRSGKEGSRHWDLTHMGEDDSSFFSVDAPATIDSRISRFSNQPDFDHGLMTPPGQLSLHPQVVA